ncbi:MAG: YkgJ family cysteine cluster protein [Gammaproteobacteria bacterium]|nr:YkgJ family cysteine cluster protein [Gammaproteobacteria bacterium]
MSDSNPCLTCGACCAFFRVSFFWGECESAGGSVPDSMVSAINSTYVAMIGTDRKPARCNALMGDIGQGVRCTMYEKRSSSCQEFQASWENGVHNPHCDAARAAHGLPPIDPPIQPTVSPDRVA